MGSASNVNEAAPLFGSNGESQMHMDPKLFEAAAKGNIEPFKNFAEELITESLVTNNKSTILHINIISQNEKRVSTKFVVEIPGMYPLLLLQSNAKGDTPLHVAAKGGHVDIVRVLIESTKALHHDDLESGVAAARQIIGATNNSKSTALHEAVRHDDLDVVKILTKEDPDFPYTANNSSQTPLYIAAAKGSSQMVLEILENCKSAAHEGTNGKTALHAAVMSRNPILMKQLLEKKQSLIRETDEYGWTPLHYAAYHYRPNMVRLLLEFDRSIVFAADRDRKMTALHMAAGRGYADIIEEIISQSPECYEQVDNRGSLINEEDAKGNTPLHVLATSRRHARDGIFSRNSKADLQAVNRQNLSVEHIMRFGFRDLEREIQELSEDVGRGQYPRGVIEIRGLVPEEVTVMEKARESHLVVATLIATVAFAAAFTIPGGYESEKSSDQGTAILRRNSAFRAFIITDTIAMIFSLSAVFVHFIMSIPSCQNSWVSFHLAFYFTMISMAAMVVAFVTGTYAMLAPALGLAIVTCFIALSFLLASVLHH